MFRPRIIILDDLTTMHDMMEALLLRVYQDAIILSFSDAGQAWAELQRQDPDLLTTDWNHKLLPGAELLQRLAARKVEYPIFIISAFAKEAEVRNAAGPDLNVCLLSKPFKVEDLLDQLRSHVGPLDSDALW